MQTADDGYLVYCGPRGWQTGYVAVSVEVLRRGPFRYKVVGVPKNHIKYLLGDPFARNIPTETFYYLTFTGFRGEWKRMQTPR